MLIVALTLANSAFLPEFAHPTVRKAPAATPAIVSRARVPLAYLGPEDEETSNQHLTSIPAALYSKTENGLSYKDLEQGDGEPFADDSMVSLQYTMSVVSTNEVIMRTGLTFVLGTPGFGSLLTEATQGMRVGGKRRVLIPPSSSFAAMDDETIEFEITAVSVKTDREKALLQA